MRKDSKERLLILGFDTELIKKIDSYHLTLSGLRGQNMNSLERTGFTTAEAKLIVEKVKRNPIDEIVLRRILSKSGSCCAYCADGINTRPFQIHHIEEYHLTHDNSEKNLLLVCPTHHSAIHDNHYSYEEQKSTKRTWETIFTIAKTYQRKGVSFPYRSFLPIDYKYKGNVIEIFSFSPPRPSVCVNLLQEGLTLEARRLLEKENRLIITGQSGSGKTTLAIGLAGSLQGFAVFNYVVPKDSQKAITEILLFISQLVKKTVLIVDDVNVQMSPGQVEQLLLAARNNVKLIVVTTHVNASANENIAHHFVNSVLSINWNLLKQGVRKYLMSSEDEVIRYLEENNLTPRGTFPLGSGVVHMRLSQLIDNYANEVETVWQFIYIMSSGINRIVTLQDDLYSDERMDLVVLYLAILQIAKTEAGASVSEVEQLYRTHSSLSHLPPPDKVWIEKKLEQLIRNRILVSVRGRYKTIHREFARNFIDHSYLKITADTTELLSTIFNNFGQIKEIVILWSWLQDTHARAFVQLWYRALDIKAWKRLVQAAADDSLATLSLLADRMNYIAPSGYLPIKECFTGKEQVIAEYINSSEGFDSLYYLERLFMTLERNCPEVVRKALETFDPRHFADIIKIADPAVFENLYWLFISIAKVYPEWIIDLQVRFKDEDFFVIIEKTTKGDVNSMVRVVDFQKSFIADLKRSHLKRYYTRFADIVKGCRLDEIRFGPTYYTSFYELLAFPADINTILESLDVKKLSSDYVTISPRSWGNLLTLSSLSPKGSTVIRRIVNGISVSMLKKNIEKYLDQYHYELRVLIYQLGYGSPGKKKQFAAMLHPFIDQIIGEHKKDVDDILVAYYNLDESWAEQISRTHGIPKPHKSKTSMNMAGKELNEIRKKAKEMDASGEDYIFRETKIRLTDDKKEVGP